MLSISYLNQAVPPVRNAPLIRVESDFERRCTAPLMSPENLYSRWVFRGSMGTSRSPSKSDQALRIFPVFFPVVPVPIAPASNAASCSLEFDRDLLPGSRPKKSIYFLFELHSERMSIRISSKSDSQLQPKSIPRTIPSVEPKNLETSSCHQKSRTFRK